MNKLIKWLFYPQTGFLGLATFAAAITLVYYDYFVIAAIVFILGFALSEYFKQAAKSIKNKEMWEKLMNDPNVEYVVVGEAPKATSVFHDQYEFLDAADNTERSSENMDLALKLIHEEFEELREDPSSINSLKEAIDLIYVTAQFLNTCVGPDKAQELWDIVHENNMSKCINGKLVKREDGKVLKPESYKKLTDADIEEVLKR